MATLKENRSPAGELVSYRVRALMGIDSRGRQVRRTKTISVDELDATTPAKRMKEAVRLAELWEIEERAKYERGVQMADPSRITLEKFITEHWAPDCVQDGSHPPTTVRDYEFCAQWVIKYFGEKKLLTKIRPEDCKRFATWLKNDARKRNGAPLSATSSAHIFTVFKMLMGYARRMDYIKENPVERLNRSEIPHRVAQEVDYLTVDEIRNFLSVVDMQPTFWRLAFRLFVFCGLRRGELAGLQWQDINTGERTLTVSRNVTIDTKEKCLHIGQPKNHKGRTVPFPEMLLPLFAEQRNNQIEQFGGVVMPNAYIFNGAEGPYTPIFPDAIARHLSRMTKGNQLGRIHPHQLRHSYATLALTNGVDLKTIQSTLGHADPVVTMRFYSGVVEQSKRDAVDKLAALLG